MSRPATLNEFLKEGSRSACTAGAIVSCVFYVAIWVLKFCCVLWIQREAPHLGHGQGQGWGYIVFHYMSGLGSRLGLRLIKSMLGINVVFTKCESYLLLTAELRKLYRHQQLFLA